MSTLLLGTRKGLIVFRKDNSGWKLTDTHFPGAPVSMVHSDKTSGIWWACLDHGHWGVKLHRSADEGKTWEELQAPAYPKGAEVKDGTPASLRYIWSTASIDGKLYLGTDPGGLFESTDNGDSFQLNMGLWDHPTRKGWFGGGRDQPGIHSICINPSNKDHIYIGISCAGIFETTDGGKSWCPRNKGLNAPYLPDPDAEVGFDPHLLVMSSDPKTLWQQNHIGIFKSDNGAQSWVEVSEKDGPAKFGFTIAAHPDNKDMAWVIPAASDDKRMAIDGKLQVCRTEDGGKTWKSFSNGLPQTNCYDLVYRHSLAFNGTDMAFASTTGNLFVSSDLGESWSNPSNFLPPVYCVYLLD